MRLVGRWTICVVIFIAFVFPTTSAAKSCSAMMTELAKLRTEYHEYATRKSSDSAGISFDGLVEILDRIVALKGEMRKSRCAKIPPNPYSKSSP